MEHMFNHQVVQDDALPGIYRCLAVMTRRGLLISVGLVYTLRTVSILHRNYRCVERTIRYCLFRAIFLNDVGRSRVCAKRHASYIYIYIIYAHCQVDVFQKRFKHRQLIRLTAGIRLLMR